jgi:transcriptional regulator with XRE-family HTH domain
MGIDRVRKKLEAARHAFEYRLEKILYDMGEQVCALIEGQKVTRRELAQRLDVSPAYITKLLNGNPNLTIKTLLKLSDALNQTLDIRFTPKQELTLAGGVAPTNAFLNVFPGLALGTANTMTSSQPIVMNTSDLVVHAATIQLPNQIDTIDQSSKMNEAAADHDLALAA